MKMEMTEFCRFLNFSFVILIFSSFSNGGEAEDKAKHSEIVMYLDLELATKECEVAEANAELKKVREDLHIAQVELGKKAVEILDLQSAMERISGELKTVEARLTRAEDLSRIIAELKEELEREKLANRELRAELSEGNQETFAKPTETGGASVAASVLVEKNRTFVFTAENSTDYQQREHMVEEIVELMNRHPGARIKLTGHADDFLSEAKNREASERRAEFLLQHLVSKGVPREALSAEGRGKSEPSLAGNRRVDVELIIR